MPWDESRVRIGQELLQHRAWAVKQRDRGTKRQVARVQAGQRDPELAGLIVIPRIEGRLGCGLKCRRRPGGRRDPGLGGRVAVPGGRRDPDERLGDRRRPQRVATAPGGAAPSRRRGGDLRRRRATSIRPSYERPSGRCQSRSGPSGCFRCRPRPAWQRPRAAWASARRRRSHLIRICASRTIPASAVGGAGTPGSRPSGAWCRGSTGASCRRRGCCRTSSVRRRGRSARRRAPGRATGGVASGRLAHAGVVTAGWTSDRQGKLVEGDCQPSVHRLLDCQLVVPAANVLDEGVSGDHDPGAVLLPKPAHRS